MHDVCTELVQEYLGSRLEHPMAVWVLDGSDFPQQGVKSAWRPPVCSPGSTEGALGKIANARLAVPGPARPRGRALVDRPQTAVSAGQATPITNPWTGDGEPSCATVGVRRPTGGTWRCWRRELVGHGLLVSRPVHEATSWSVGGWRCPRDGMSPRRQDRRRCGNVTTFWSVQSGWLRCRRGSPTWTRIRLTRGTGQGGIAATVDQTVAVRGLRDKTFRDAVTAARLECWRGLIDIAAGNPDGPSRLFKCPAGAGNALTEARRNPLRHLAPRTAWRFGAPAASVC